MALSQAASRRAKESDAAATHEQVDRRKLVRIHTREASRNFFWAIRRVYIDAITEKREMDAERSELLNGLAQILQGVKDLDENLAKDISLNRGASERHGIAADAARLREKMALLEKQVGTRGG